MPVLISNFNIAFINAMYPASSVYLHNGTRSNVNERKEVFIRLIHLPTGKRVTAKMRYLVDAHRMIEMAIVRYFPETQEAKDFQTQGNTYRVGFNSDWEETFSETMMVWLRKLADSKASSLWWNLFNDMPGGVYGYIAKNVKDALKAEVEKDQTSFLYTLISIVKTSIAISCNEMFDDIRGKAYDEETREFLNSIRCGDLRESEKTAILTTLKYAILSIDYLTDDDIVAMLSYSIKW